jgi:hypothetical protein
MDLDLTVARRAKGFPLYWLGPTTAHGMIPSFVTAAFPTYFGLSYNDCGFYGPERCGETVGVTSNSTCASDVYSTSYDLINAGVPSHLSVRRGVLVSDPGPGNRDPELFAGRTTIELYEVAVGAAFERLKVLGESAPADLPGTALPDWLWQKLRAVERSYSHTYDDAATARELHITTREAKQRRLLAKRLRALGVTATLDCG